jgi:LPXTG-motif cell wall-anchored protein
VPTPGQSRQWILWAALGLVVLIPVGVVLLRKRKV